jgi:hypothetical protein
MMDEREAIDRLEGKVRYRIFVRGYDYPTIATFLESRYNASGVREFHFRAADGGSVIRHFALTADAIDSLERWSMVELTARAKRLADALRSVDVEPWSDAEDTWIEIVLAVAMTLPESARGAFVSECRR